MKKINHVSEKSDSGGSVNANRIKAHRMEKIIKKHYVPNRRGFLYYVILLLLCGFFFMHFFSVMMKDPAQKKLAKDLKEQILPVDYFSWNVYANVYYALWQDVCRFTREGWLKNDAAKSVTDQTLFFKCK